MIDFEPCAWTRGDGRTLRQPCCGELKLWRGDAYPYAGKMWRESGTMSIFTRVKLSPVLYESKKRARRVGKRRAKKIVTR